MAPKRAVDDVGPKSARSKRKAKEKANQRKRAAAGNAVNPYAVLEDSEGEREGDGEDAETMAEQVGGGSDDARPKTSNSNSSGETLVGGGVGAAAAARAPAVNDTAPQEPLNPNSSQWTYDEIPDIREPAYPNEDPNSPLTEAELRHEEIKTWLTVQKGHAFHLKKATIERLTDFLYVMKYEAARDRREWMRECRLVVWRAVVRANFWWRNPETNEPTGKPAPINTPSGIFENNFALFVTCAAERLDRVGRDLPDPEYVGQIEETLRLFFRRADVKGLARQLEHLAFLMLLDEEQNRFLTREDVQARLRMCFDGVKAMDWSGLGAVTMGHWPVKKHDAPWRGETVWVSALKRFGVLAGGGGCE